ncbi:MAG: hypothetical protein IKP79_02020 [Bacilli bacterium]|nr:hypothetical protein [Bacilli bacterium]
MKNVGKILMLIALLLIAVGVGINFYQTMFAKEEVVPEENVEEESTEINLDDYTTRINEQLSNFIMYYYNETTDNGVDLLTDSTKRLALLNLILEQNGTAQDSEGNTFKYVPEDTYREQYITLYGNDSNYTIDMQTYAVKDVVDQALGEGYIGWDPNRTPSTTSKTFTATGQNNDNGTITISGVYQDTELSTETTTGQFIITYQNDFLVSIVLNTQAQTDN